MIDLRRAEQRLGYEHQPARAANRARNLLATKDRDTRWRPARDAAWTLIEPLPLDGARVAITGAGNGHDVPLRRLARRAGEITLFDVDPAAMRRARGRLPRRDRARVTTVVHDITDGAADAIVTAAARRAVPEAPLITERPLPGAPYDLVIGDLLYSQLLYPGLVDREIPTHTRAAILARYGPQLTRGVVARLHVSAPYRPVVHMHDVLGWWPGHQPPATADELVGLAQRDLNAAVSTIGAADGPRDSDPRGALRELNLPIQQTRLWVWPFSDQITYLVCATLAGATPTHSHRVRGPNAHTSPTARRA